MGRKDSLIPRHSLARQAAHRLMWSLGMVVLVVGLSSALLYRHTLEKANRERNDQLQAFYAARLAQMEREWELHARSYRVLIEYTRRLEETASGEAGLQAFLTIQGGDRRFQHLIVADRSGAPRFQFGKSLNLDLFPLPPEEDNGWYADPVTHQIYRVFGDRIWLGKGGMGRVAMLFAVDNALLGQLAAPGVTLYTRFDDAPAASSGGADALDRIDGKALARLPDLSWSGQQDCPMRLAIRAPVRPLFSIEELALGVSSIPILDGLILWFGLGAWILLHTRRLRRLHRAVREFSASGSITEEFRSSIQAAHPRRHDEIGDLAEALREMAKAREEEESQRRLMAQVFDNCGEGIVICDAGNQIVAVNNAFTLITGYTPEEVLGKNPRCLSAGLEEPAYFKAMWDSIAATGQWKGEVRDRRKDGTVFPKWLSIAAIHNPRGELTHYVGMFSDITERKVAEQRLTHLATHDSLTGLPNRHLLTDRLEGAIALARREGLSLAVLFLDLDRFKWVNDTLGHAAGDRLLIEVAGRLLGAVRESDTVARLGGDEFVLMVQGHASPADLGQVAQKAIAAVSRPVWLKDRELHITTSVGIGIFPRHGESAEMLLQRADTAMYAAKNAGRNQWKFFDGE